MSNELQRANKVLQRLNELAAFSEDIHCLTRTFGSNAFIEARSKVETWMKEAGLQTRIDNIGNLRGILRSQYNKAKTFVIASHIDTVINAGRYDGPLGVMTGIDLLEQIINIKEEFPFHIELIAFCDEEGCRFHTTYLGSKVVAGLFEEALLETKDENGIYLREVISEIGGNKNRLKEDVIAVDDWAGYFEIHIEQGPVLFNKNIPVAIVTAIAGQCRVGIIFKGEAGHAGTVPMDMRKDALACAAEFILATENYAEENKKNIVATIGKLHIINSAANVIPGEVICSLDLRSADDTLLNSSYEAIKNIVGDICRKRNVVSEWNLVQKTKPVACDPAMNKILAQAIIESNFEKVELVSGAGHDAVPVSGVSPVAMLFVRCFKGISHNPLENVELKDIAAAIKVSDNFIRAFARTFKY
ncbi:MAG: allantoate amidohydrolase [Chitinophagaceae bacterium]